MVTRRLNPDPQFPRVCAVGDHAGVGGEPDGKALWSAALAEFWMYSLVSNVGTKCVRPVPWAWAATFVPAERLPLTLGSDFLADYCWAAGSIPFESTAPVARNWRA